MTNVQVQNSYSNSQEGTGALYLVATPIGNLDDMTFRAIKTLQEADIIAAEDTRESRKLLTYFDIQGKKLYSYHEHNKRASGPELVRLMQEGQRIALVSDAGLPAISDPGADLVQLAVEVDIPVIPVPGANAALSALIASGLPTDQFMFIGFLPRDRKSIDDILDSVKRVKGSILLYESPHRLIKTLDRIGEVLGDRRVTVARELTKRYEQFTRGKVSECIAYYEAEPPLGECCIVIEGATEEYLLNAQDEIWWSGLSITEHVARYEEAEGMSKKDAMKQAAKDRGLSKRDIYQELLAAQNEE
ncbi:16S rRNA (cytidine(1402)-2'-O)-methyltransferase [Paenibacillus marinisediminis]